MRWDSTKFLKASTLSPANVPYDPLSLPRETIMEYRLTCVLFGHYFLRQELKMGDGSKETPYTNVTYTRPVHMDFCQKCGLTKSECGIAAQLPN